MAKSINSNASITGTSIKVKNAFRFMKSVLYFKIDNVLASTIFYA
ncbi:hypothetical protein [Pontibacter arcticus]|nr:hypothetical protein [Pontibacter arcticus]